MRDKLFEAASVKEILFTRLELPDDAISWLMDLWYTIQTFDDYADGDPVDRDELDLLIVRTLVFMPSNPFYRRNMDSLIPVVANAVQKWKASDLMERAGKANEQSYMLRSSYYDVVLQVCILVHGMKYVMAKADKVMESYGEAFKDYMADFSEVDHA